MSNLLSFYRGNGLDAAGRRIEEIWAWDDECWEEVHDYIQWLFPTRTPSNFNRLAPEVSAEDIEAFRSDDELQSRMRRSFDRFLHFAGLTRMETGQIAERDNFDVRCDDVWTFENHNWLRISRILESLRLFGLDTEADAFFHWLESAHQRGLIGSADAESRTRAANSLRLWRQRAMRSGGVEL